jgi:GT2 family glycosyltransferase
MIPQTKVSIVILTYNNLAYTRQCLDSVFAKTDYPDYEVIVVDNASQDETPHYLTALQAQHANLKVILSPTNTGFAGGNNLGAAAATGEYIVFLNNDTIVTPGWLGQLVAHVQDPRVGMAGPVTNSAGNESCIDVDYHLAVDDLSNLPSMEAFAERYTRTHAGESFEISMLAFMCVILRRQVFEQIGPLDERFGVGMFEDDDYAERLHAQGYKIVCAEDVFIHHWGSASFSRLGQAAYRRLFEENRRKFEAKWGRTWQPHLGRPGILQKQVLQMIDDAAYRALLIEERDQTIQEQKQVIANQQQTVDGHVQIIQDQRHAIQARERFIQEQKQLIAAQQETVNSHARLIAEQQQAIADQQAEFAQRLEEKEQALAQAQQHLTQKEAAIAAQQATLSEIYASAGWKMVRKAWEIRLALAPEGSPQERLIKWLLRKGQAVKAKIEKPRITWYAYLFERFKAARQAQYAPSLATLRDAGEKDLVSIILPVYNGADYIEEALDSILAQTYTHFELIVVDDGSTDATPALLDQRAAQEPRLRVVHQPNQRLPRALNNGFRLARGEYLTWTSADNHLKPDFLEKMVASLARHPDWEMIYANVDIIGDNGEPLRGSDWFASYQNPPGSEHVHLPVYPAELNIYPNNYVNAAFLYRRRAALLVGDYSPNRFGTEDYDYWMRVNALLTLKHADFVEPVYDYRFHQTSLTSRDKELGITKSRAGLMVFEDARRDFYQTPLAWLIETDGTPAAQQQVQAVRAWLQAAGHLLVAPTLNLEQTPRWWFPLVGLYITGQAGQAVPPANWPATTFRVLLADSAATPSAPGWDLCLTTDAQATLPPPTPEGPPWLAAAESPVLCTAIDIRAKAAHLAGLEDLIARPPTPALKLSVVIATYRRGPQLINAVRSVAQQSLAPTDYEVILVNNDVEDPGVAQVAEAMWASDFAGRRERLRLVMCPFKGLSFARNAGISEARGEVVCFIDDDALAEPDWLEQTWQAFQQFPQAGVVGGKILLCPPEPQPRWFKPGWEALWSHFNPGYTEPTCIEQWYEYPWGANWSARREALLRIGGFRTNYGRRGADFSGGEEMVAASLIKTLGYQIVVTPFSQVRHLPAVERYSREHVRKTILASIMSDYRQRIDLYLPMDLELSYLQQQRAKRLNQCLFPLTQPWHKRLEHYFYAAAYQRVGQQMQADLEARARLYTQAYGPTP